jgi:polyisoprenoid-binding protein YceI
MKTAIKVLSSAILAAVTAAPAFAAPEVFVVDNTHTYPRFSYNHLGFSTQLSRFNKTSGKVVFDREAKTGSVDIVIDMKSVDTGFGTFDEHIQAADFLDIWIRRAIRAQASSQPRSSSMGTSPPRSKAT